MVRMKGGSSRAAARFHVPRDVTVVKGGKRVICNLASVTIVPLPRGAVVRCRHPCQPCCFFRPGVPDRYEEEMVFYFTSNVVSPPATLFMGRDKHENEDLIKWGWPEDVWFHVDKMSSAHVYLRLQKGQTLDDIPQTLLEDAGQLVKANSISGNKVNNVEIVYCFWGNLKKTAAMDVGQVSFHKDKEVRKFQVDRRSNEIVNRLNKTKTERNLDLRAEREDRDREEREEEKSRKRQEKLREKEEEKKREEEAKERSYTTLMTEQNMKSNKEEDYDSDDFM